MKDPIDLYKRRLYEVLSDLVAACGEIDLDAPALTSVKSIDKFNTAYTMADSLLEKIEKDLK